jgi:hypothetical protein
LPLKALHVFSHGVLRGHNLLRSPPACSLQRHLVFGFACCCHLLQPCDGIALLPFDITLFRFGVFFCAKENLFLLNALSL